MADQQIDFKNFKFQREEVRGKKGLNNLSRFENDLLGNFNLFEHEAMHNVSLHESKILLEHRQSVNDTPRDTIATINEEDQNSARRSKLMTNSKLHDEFAILNRSLDQSKLLRF